ncbi:MAG: hypothetical protein ABI045_01625 [Flavobacteriales bacterium]
MAYPCGGPHLSNTKELTFVRVLKVRGKIKKIFD